jgi:putative redox protein
MVQVDIAYEGSLACAATHGPSGTVLRTDAPVDNHGKGSSFSPTDLVATALGTCMLTVMAIVAQRIGVDLAGTRVCVTKEMAATPQRRIGKLTVTFFIPAAPSDEQRKRLESAAMTCPVHHSLHPDVLTPIEFKWGVER